MLRTYKVPLKCQLLFYRENVGCSYCIFFLQLIPPVHPHASSIPFVPPAKEGASFHIWFLRLVSPLLDSVFEPRPLFWILFSLWISSSTCHLESRKEECERGKKGRELKTREEDPLHPCCPSSCPQLFPCLHKPSLLRTCLHWLSPHPFSHSHLSGMEFASCLPYTPLKLF